MRPRALLIVLLGTCAVLGTGISAAGSDRGDGPRAAALRRTLVETVVVRPEADFSVTTKTNFTLGKDYVIRLEGTFRGAGFERDWFSSAYGSGEWQSDASPAYVDWGGGTETMPALLGFAKPPPPSPSHAYESRLPGPVGTGRMRIVFGSGLCEPSESPCSGGLTVKIYTVTGARPDISIADARGKEGDGAGGRRWLTFKVRLSSRTPLTVSVWYEAFNIGFATGDGRRRDYLKERRQLVFRPGERVKLVRVELVGDTVPEPDETFAVRLFDQTNGRLGRRRATGTIVDDDIASFRVFGGATREGNDPSSRKLRFTVALSPTSERETSVAFQTVPASARAGRDYRTRIGRLRFRPGERRKRVAVQIVGERDFEPDETLSVRLSGATGGARIASRQAQGKILNDDRPPVSISIADASGPEGSGPGNAKLVFLVRLSGRSTKTVTAGWQTKDGTAASAPGQSQDFLPASGTVRFPAGTTEQRIEVEISGDNASERDETFVVELQAAKNARIARGTAQGTIVDDDAGSPSSVIPPDAMP